jgi:hypothetical protein
VSTPVSGPGQFSKRTDKAVSQANRSLPNADYGEQAAYQEAQQGMQRPQEVNVQGMNFNDLFGNPAASVTPFDAESARPDEPVTQGADAGPGGDSSTLASSGSQKDPTMEAYMFALKFIADRPGTSDAARNLIRNLRSRM